MGDENAIEEDPYAPIEAMLNSKDWLRYVETRFGEELGVQATADQLDAMDRWRVDLIREEIRKRLQAKRIHRT